MREYVLSILDPVLKVTVIMGRYRERFWDPWESHLTYGSTDILEGPFFAGEERCWDDLGKETDHPLTIIRETRTGGEADWAGTFHLTGQTNAGLDLPTSMNTQITSWVSQFTAQKIAVATAPLRPSVYSLTNVLEFRDIPRMLKHAGDLLHNLTRNPARNLTPTMIASTILAYQFGWKPILEDLLKMADFGDLVNRRQQELEDLNSGKSVRKKVKFGSISGDVDDNLYVHSTGGCFIYTSRHTTWSATAWATAHWSLSDMGLLGKKPTWWQAFNSLYGLPLGEIPVQIWKALPWSWLFDWFANLSEALEVSKNLISYKPSRINLMWTIRKDGSYQAQHPTPTRHWSGMQQTWVSKNRSQPSDSVTGVHLRIPFLDPYKLSVLGSLTILQIRRGLG